MNIAPECRRCEKRHWRFVKCADVDPVEAEALEAATRPVQIQWWSNMDRVVGNRLTSVDITSTPGVTWRVKPKEKS